ncbi:MAG: sigma-54-dependent Fis family transcriptional regulator [Chromatiales bacterium 21-64-14]|nr:MAG: sigma-54-dependent Fis family transcriptional regulator [Chromatiales bacterium 21-64-14]HQU15090.1 sigma-54 dependent transcriptional regulator [Gammaproteobacteria bacterium]
MAEQKVLILDKDPERAARFQTVLEFMDYEPVFVAECRGRLKEKLGESGPYLAAFIGECDPEKELRVRLKELADFDPNIPTFLLGNAESVSIASSNGNGAARILGSIEVPIKYAQLTNALHQAQIYRENQSGQEQRRPVELFRSLVGNSRSVQSVRKLIQQVAETEATVLILGESGTGKEVVARNIHYYSTRRDRPFVPINCGAIPPDLLESELFGHEKGAFTGAISARQGRFELAEGGTLFLDEIGDMPMAMQVKLLRVLQEKNFERVGSNKTIGTDVRIIAATHRNLEEAIESQRFREDLYYRLNVFPIEMPPLRERIEDIPLLVNELITRIEHEKRGSVRLTSAGVLCLCQYAWPGNVRELANLIERLAILYPFGVVDVNELPEKFRQDDGAGPVQSSVEPFLAASLTQVMTEPRLPREGIDLKEHLSHLEVSFIKQALDDADGVVAHAAKRLGMRRTTLVEKLRKYGLQRSDEMPSF